MSAAATFTATAAIPFAGLLLSIAVLPLVAHKFWHAHYGKVAAAWALLFLVPFSVQQGITPTLGVIGHVALEEYLPFVILLAALYTAAGGIFIRGNLHGSPALNVGLMAIGALLASVMGTTGASMLLIRPLLRANDNRQHNAHVVVFFIFIVSNVGGSLTPLGDPPLFLGFLQGVSFFWTARHVAPETLFLVVGLLAVFWVIDSYYYRKEGITRRDPTPDDPRLGLEGAINFAPLAAVIALVLMSGVWKPGITVNLGGTGVPLPSLLRDAGLLLVIAWSLFVTPKGLREKNQFSWEPMKEVAKLFAAIFLTMVPVLAMLKAGSAGPFAAVTDAVNTPWSYFWATGLLSAFLDNAPTYLVFFNLAGGDAKTLMTTMAPTLAAISSGAVFMGALSYIGNAPNFMVKAIAEERGVKMPSFFGFMAWSCAVLLPLLVLMSLIWFR